MDITSKHDNISKDKRTCFLTRSTGIVEPRRLFNLSSYDENDLLHDLTVLLKQTWNILGVSIMFNFQSNDKIQLKQYAKKLREEVARILSHEKVSYEAKFSVLDMCKPTETDHAVVEIEVYAQVTDKENKETCVYKGYFFSWRSKTTDTFPKNAVKLPLHLCRGTPNTMRAVHSTLSRMFDCMFIPLSVNSDDLMWLLPILISPSGGQNTSKHNDEAMLEYSIPTLPNSSSITIKFHVHSLINLWKSFLERRDKIRIEEVEKFHEVLHKQVIEISNLHLGFCILHRISLPSITISQAKMKVMNVETMNTLLTYLNEKALGVLHRNITQLCISK